MTTAAADACADRAAALSRLMLERHTWHHRVLGILKTVGLEAAAVHPQAPDA
jgi:hypothetical protein